MGSVEHDGVYMEKRRHLLIIIFFVHRNCPRGSLIKYGFKKREIEAEKKPLPICGTNNTTRRPEPPPGKRKVRFADPWILNSGKEKVVPFGFVFLLILFFIFVPRHSPRINAYCKGTHLRELHKSSQDEVEFQSGAYHSSRL